MGVFDYFRRRRERESAIPQGTPESLTRQLKGDGTPIGQPVGQAFPQAGQPALDMTGGMDLGAVLGLVQQAWQSGNVQVTQGESQVIDLRNSPLRDQIVQALEQHGIDAQANGQIDAGDVPGLQNQIMEALQKAGVDIGQFEGAGAGELGSSGGDTGFSGGDSGGGDSGGGDSGGGGGSE